MVSDYMRQQILNYHIVNGYGYKKITKILGGHPCQGTIKKILKKYESLLATSGLKAAREYYTHGEKFKTPEREKKKLTPEIQRFIEERVRENEEKIVHNNRKQCQDMKTVYAQLLDQGHDICYSSVTGYARAYKARLRHSDPEVLKECFIRQYHVAGEECQFDWGDVKVYIGGKLMTLKIAVFCLPHSNYRVAYLFRKEDTLAFIESHVRFFHDIGHIPMRMVYDNMRVAVKKFVGTDKLPTEALINLSTFYCFQYRFCNARRGNEKGYVEESVKVVRPAAFSVRDHFDTIEEAQEWLTASTERLNNTHCSSSGKDVIRLSQEDFDAMRPWTEDYSCYKMRDNRVDKYATITVDKAVYSVPDTLVEKMVSVKEYSNRLEVFYKDEKVAEHEKIAAGEWHVLLEHYLRTMSYKPGSVKNSVALRQAPEGIRRIFEEAFADKPKDFVSLLLDAKKAGADYNAIISAYERLKGQGINSVSAEMVRSVLIADKNGAQVIVLMRSQDGKSIESYSEEGLRQLAAIMEGMHHGERLQ